MTDFHAHVLPCADHGSDSLETSQQQLRLARKAGIDTIVATPHFYPQYDEPDEYCQRRQKAFAQLQSIPQQEIRLLLGAEVQLCAGLENLSCLKELRIAGTRTILLELPFSALPNSLFDTVQNLLDSPDYVPVLAHVDRYPHEVIEHLFSMGCVGQVNAEGLCHRVARKRLMHWVQTGKIVALGSDIHGTQVGYTEFAKAQSILGDALDTVMQRTQALLTME